MILAKVYQDAEIIDEAINRGENIAISYYQRIAGFTDESAAKAFLEIIETRHGLLKSQAIYDNCHEKLVSSTLKAKYTRLRKKHEYM